MNLIIANNQAKALMKNQNKAIEALQQIEGNDKLFLRSSRRGVECFVPLQSAYLSKFLKEQPKVPVYSSDDFPIDVEKINQCIKDFHDKHKNISSKKETGLDDIWQEEWGQKIIATYGIQQMNLNVIVDEEGFEV